MAHTRMPSPLNSLGAVVGLSLMLLAWPSAWGFPMEGRELDSAVDGVQKYLESSGFPKMTRGEVLDFLNDFSRNARVSRSQGASKKDASAPPQVPSPSQPQQKQGTVTRKDEPAKVVQDGLPNIPHGESPLNYGYPMSAMVANKRPVVDLSPVVATGRGLADHDRGNNGTGEDKNAEAIMRAMGVRGGLKKTVGPSVDLNAYTKFKKIPEGKNLKIDDDMRMFLGGFGLLDGTTTTTTVAATKTDGPQRRRSDDDATVTETVDTALLKSVLKETSIGSGVNETAVDLSDVLLQESASGTRDHVFNPSDPDVRTVDVNRIAKIVENIRLLANDNDTVSLSQEAIQKKLENITAAIAAIDKQPAAVATTAATAPGAPDKPFDGYEVFFDDETKEMDSDLPDSPTTGSAEVLDQLPLNKAHNPPDPLSTDELQHLFEKNKNEVKRQEPPVMSDDDVTTTTTASEAAVSRVATSTAAADTTTTSIPVSASSADSSSEATSVEATSGSSAARDSSTAAAADVSPSLSQLAESFGGGETASNPPPAAVDGPVSPDRPRSGLYFYVDWNSFLTVNEGQKNQVNLRFAPKAGNPAHFIKVNVP